MIYITRSGKVKIADGFLQNRLCPNLRPALPSDQHGLPAADKLCHRTSTGGRRGAAQDTANTPDGLLAASLLGFHSARAAPNRAPTLPRLGDILVGDVLCPSLHGPNPTVFAVVSLQRCRYRHLIFRTSRNRRRHLREPLTSVGKTSLKSVRSTG
jgi:hypothetical protein